MANSIDTSRPAREHLLFQTYKAFDESPPSPEICKLRDGARTFVPGDGSMYPKAVFIGEAPGVNEDKQGAPFVGRSGKFLDELMLIAGLRREEVWITNVVKYRPPGNRTPEPEEIKFSLSLLRRELAYVAKDRCRLVVGLGRVACSAMAGAPISVGKEHGTVRPLKGGWSLFVSYHPSAGLRSAAVKRGMHEDFGKLFHVMKEQR